MTKRHRDQEATLRKLADLLPSLSEAFEGCREHFGLTISPEAVSLSAADEAIREVLEREAMGAEAISLLARVNGGDCDPLCLSQQEDDAECDCGAEQVADLLDRARAEGYLREEPDGEA